ncbi:UDP-N-acetyl-D-mannosamine dehydrogenase [bacterium]|nr:UDP-N-acetyl-D-mannosamine dehydrogenase [bacterium]
MRVIVLGLGYIGLPTASLLATKGMDVLGIDIRKDVVDIINAGKIHITEPDLDILVKSGINSGKLKASTEIECGEVFIIAVPTPFKENFEPDLKYIKNAVESICKVLKSGDLIILESTSPVGTTELIAEQILKARCDLVNENGELEAYVAHCPERVLPGKILRELVDNDRIVGGINRVSTDKASEFYSIFVNGYIIKTDSRTAELSKLVENSYRDTNIAFANEISMICDDLEIDVWELIKLANHHPRVNILKPGPGVGGHCLAVDPYFIISSSPENTKIIKKARQINDKKIEFVIDKVRKKADKFKNPVIVSLGLTYKENIDDTRESPALKITKKLLESGLNISAIEPNIKSKEIDGIQNVSIKSGIEKADIVLILVRHKEFEYLNKTLLDDKIVIDTVGLLT